MNPINPGFHFPGMQEALFLAVSASGSRETASILQGCVMVDGLQKT
jgi:hypothetical protein